MSNPTHAPTNCTDCKLHHQRGNVVNGTGKFSSPTFFIVGEAPGREDDQCGRPFSGGSGKILYSLLSDAGVSSTNCYFSHLVRCRPPNNRVPDLDELLACGGYLAAEIKSVNPHIVVALGDTASALLTGKAPVSTWRGAIVDGIGCATGYKVLITHPAAFVMKMRTMFPVVTQDFVKAKRFDHNHVVVEQYKLNPSPVVIAEWFERCYATLPDVACDIETTADKEDGGKDDALNPYKGEIIGLAFCCGPGDAIHMSGNCMRDNWDVIARFLNTYPRLVWANNLFDRFFIKVKTGVDVAFYADVQDMMHMIYAALPKKLAFLISLYTTIPPYKYVYKDSVKSGQWDFDRLGRYNCIDVDGTWQVFQAQKNEIPQQSLIGDLQRENTIALAMKVYGVYVDQNAVAKHYATILPTISRLEQYFAKTYGVSISSPKQLNTLLYDTLRFPPYDDKGKSTFRAKGSTNEKAIQGVANSIGLVYLNDDEGERFEGEHKHKDVLANILEYRGLAKIASTYCEGVFRAIESDGRVHTGWCPTGTDTGRWSCRGVPLQGVPKDMRDIVVAAPGNILFGADYKGAQIVGAGILAGDWELVENMLNPEYSIHNDVMEAIRPFYPSIKKIQAKTVVFGTFFGRTVADIAQQFHVPRATAQLWRDIFYTKRPLLKELFEHKLPKEWEERGYVTTIDGRRKYCERVTEAKNTPVQNFESVLTKSAMWKLHEEGYRIILMGHDQIVCEEPDDDTKDDRYARFVEIMETALPQYYHKFPVDGAMGYKWSEV